MALSNLLASLKKKNDESIDDDVDLGQNQKNDSEVEKSKVPLKERKGELPKTMVGRFAENASHVRTLRLIIAVLVISLFYTLNTINNMPKQILVKYSPVLGNGATLRIGQYPKAAIFSDVEYLWLALNTWEKSGDEEADKLLTAYQNYISPEFRNYLRKSYKHTAMDRVRLPHATPGQIFDADKRVVPISRNAWIVYLDVTMHEEYLKQTVKDATYRYAFMVERYETNLDINPLGIRIVGFREEPKRIKG